MSDSTESAAVTRGDIDRLERQLADLKAASERHEASLKVGLTRMAQLQADIDLIRRTPAMLFNSDHRGSWPRKSMPSNADNHR